MINQSRLFLGSCFALITTALSFSISAGTLKNLGDAFHFTNEQLGVIGSTWFYGFPISMVIGGLIYNSIGPKKIMQIAFLCHVLGVLMAIYAIYSMPDSSYKILIISNLLMGIGCGCTEAACNPMIADMFSGESMNKMLNRFHMWFPGGIVIGALLSEAMKTAGLSWKYQYWIIIIPALIYVYLFNNQVFPKSKNDGSVSLGDNFKAMLAPLFIFMFCCMMLTANTEFIPQTWTGIIMENSGARPMIILALVTGLMAVARYFGGAIIHQLNQTGVLLGSAVLATIGIYLFSTQTGGMVYVAAIFFALGVAYFWPTMVGFVAENIPRSGALGMSVIGGIGMFATAILKPITGKWIDTATTKAANGADLKGMKDAIEKKMTDFGGVKIEDVKATVAKIELTAGQDTLSTVALFPAILIVAFGVLYFWMKNRKTA
jgi:MFS transporter, putative metabolite:H+ symporter